MLITPLGALTDIVSCYALALAVWPWLVLGIGAIALMARCNKSCNDDLTSGATSNTNTDKDEFREYDREYWGATNNHVDVGGDGAEEAEI